MLAKTAISPVHGLVKTDGDLKEKAETSKELLTAGIEARPQLQKASRLALPGGVRDIRSLERAHTRS